MSQQKPSLRWIQGSHEKAKENILLVELTGQDLVTILESLRYSKRAVSDAQCTPQSARAENLARIETAVSHLREAQKAATTDK